MLNWSPRTATGQSHLCQVSSFIIGWLNLTSFDHRCIGPLLSQLNAPRTLSFTCQKVALNQSPSTSLRTRPDRSGPILIISIKRLYPIIRPKAAGNKLNVWKCQQERFPKVRAAMVGLPVLANNGEIDWFTVFVWIGTAVTEQARSLQLTFLIVGKGAFFFAA